MKAASIVVRFEEDVFVSKRMLVGIAVGKAYEIDEKNRFLQNSEDTARAGWWSLRVVQPNNTT